MIKHDIFRTLNFKTKYESYIDLYIPLVETVIGQWIRFATCTRTFPWKWGRMIAASSLFFSHILWGNSYTQWTKNLQNRSLPWSSSFRATKGQDGWTKGHRRLQRGRRQAPICWKRYWFGRPPRPRNRSTTGRNWALRVAWEKERDNNVWSSGSMIQVDVYYIWFCLFYSSYSNV